MKRAAVFAFSRQGCKTARRIAALLCADYACGVFAPEKYAEEGISPISGSIGAFVGPLMKTEDALVFVGACGIAVRAVAPHVRSKTEDPAVVCVDERGRFAVSLLSGHIGGGNRLTNAVAAGIGAVPVITTATDVNGLFAVDVFAATNHLAIASHDGIAQVSARLLRDGYLTMSVAGECEGEIPPEVRLVPYPPKEPVDVLVAPQCEAGERCSLWLIPSCLLLGVGCRRGKSEEELEAFVRETLEKEKLSSMAVAGIASVDVKADEVGILALAEQLAVPFLTYPAGRLQGVDGTFTSSGFVAQQVGVDNVCERAAVCAAGEGGRLLVQKTACEGKTLAIAERKWSVKF